MKKASKKSPAAPDNLVEVATTAKTVVEPRLETAEVAPKATAEKVESVEAVQLSRMPPRRLLKLKFVPKRTKKLVHPRKTVSPESLVVNALPRTRLERVNTVLTANSSTKILPMGKARLSTVARPPVNLDLHVSLGLKEARKESPASTVSHVNPVYLVNPEVKEPREVESVVVEDLVVHAVETKDPDVVMFKTLDAAMANCLVVMVMVQDAEMVNSLVVMVNRPAVETSVEVKEVRSLLRLPRLLSKSEI
jgi:hypothetical protein